jgi:hypothetical protein
MTDFNINLATSFTHFFNHTVLSRERFHGHTVYNLNDGLLPPMGDTYSRNISADKVVPSLDAEKFMSVENPSREAS